MRQAFSEGMAYTPGIHRDLFFEPLWDSPLFQELIEPNG
jgi:hypothetical protein